MKLANEQTAGLWAPMKPSLEAVLARLEALSLEPGFAGQRKAALEQALRPYLEAGAATPLAPLAQEVELANLYVYADFYPEGQLSLIEQLRDTITEHVPDEERAWLDPLKHSYMDLLEVMPAEVGPPSGMFAVRSVGDSQVFRVTGGEFAKGLAAGQILFTRLIREPGDPDTDRAVIPGSAIVLSASDAQSLYQLTHEQRLAMEAASGSFALGEWTEFAKLYGYVLLWNFARMRFAALLQAVTNIRYCTPDGQPYLYAIAFYEHHEYRFLADGLAAMEGLELEAILQLEDGPGWGTRQVRTWVQRGDGTNGRTGVIARLTLTPTQLMVECDLRDRLEEIKHRMAYAFGYALRFRGESTTPPGRRPSVSDLAAEKPVSLVITPEEDRALLASFLETTYLEWADQESPALGGQTPRHAAASPAARDKVAALIDEMERNDIGRRRTGRPAFDYNRLRAHVGIEEVVR
ncbi:MAG: hypothetical protein AB1555_00140 [Nitrospirota bacterium]